MLLKFLPITLLFSFLLLYPQATIHASKNVLVKAWSDSDYRVSPDSIHQETYVFYQGHFEPGKSRSLMGKEEFDQICLQLEYALEKQSYKRVDINMENPDLIIFVHWGETTVKRKEETITFGSGQDRVSINSYQQLESYRKINAELLGTEDRIYGKTGTIKRDLAKWATDKERYFFVLEAYDFNAIENQKKSLRWTIRFSVESKWKDYNEALTNMCKVASHYFGRNLDDITFENPREPTGSVEFGELEFISSE